MFVYLWCFVVACAAVTVAFGVVGVSYFGDAIVDEEHGVHVIFLKEDEVGGFEISMDDTYGLFGLLSFLFRFIG